MARKDKLTRVAVGIGQRSVKADRKAHQVAKAGLVAKQELEDIAKQVEALKRQLQKTTKRLKGRTELGEPGPRGASSSQRLAHTLVINRRATAYP